MTRRITKHLGQIARATAVLTLFGGPLLAQNVAPPPAYAARAVHQLPDGSESSGKVVKSGPNMRLEYTQGEAQVIQIIRRAEGLMLMLDASQQSYFEIQGEPSPDPTGVGYLPPCQEEDPTQNCEFKGNEVTSGITTEVWEISRQGQPGVTTILWDGARHRALRQDFPDGRVMQMTFRAMEEVAGRQAEHWSIAIEAPGQQPLSGDWFYDPELRVEIRDVQPNGEVRSLEDIVVGPVDPALFEAPAGWTRLEMPQQPAGAPAPAPGTAN